jgi:hypothetical protein
MAKWKKTLARMLQDAKLIDYTYEEAAAVLRGLSFDLAPTTSGSHRKWRRRCADGTVVVVGLVEKGTGTLKPYLVRDMLTQLRAHDLVPSDLE